MNADELMQAYGKTEDTKYLAALYDQHRPALAAYLVEEFPSVVDHVEDIILLGFYSAEAGMIDSEETERCKLPYLYRECRSAAYLTHMRLEATLRTMDLIASGDREPVLAVA